MNIHNLNTKEFDAIVRSINVKNRDLAISCINALNIMILLFSSKAHFANCTFPQILILNF